MTTINLSTRIRFVNDDGTLTPEAYRTLQEIINRTGGALGNSGGDTFVSNDYSNIEGQQSAGGDITGDTVAQAEAQAMSEMVMQPTSQANGNGGGTSTLAPVAITVTASPFTHNATADGLLIVSGGTVTKQEYQRGAVYTEVGQLNSMLLVLAGDALRVTYSVAPTITFIPR